MKKSSAAPFRRQRPIKGGRHTLPACVIKDIADMVEKTSKRFRVSKSFVTAVALADYFNIEEQETFLPASVALFRKNRPKVASHG